jgi:hypothetical protein
MPTKKLDKGHLGNLDRETEIAFLREKGSNRNLYVEKVYLVQLAKATKDSSNSNVSAFLPAVEKEIKKNDYTKAELEKITASLLLEIGSQHSNKESLRERARKLI